MNKQEATFNKILRLLAPGTSFREGLDNVVGAKTGALIVVGYDDQVQEVVNGGFCIECPFSAAYLYELAKMDGAIILSDDGKQILYANTQLVPLSTIPSTETGIRHRTAQRTAYQTGKLVISISQRRNTITIYQGNLRYALRDIRVILTKANQAIQTLEKYKSVLDQSTTNLSAMEFEGIVTLHEVAMVIQRIEMVLRIKREIQGYINELGAEGRLISMQLEELVANVGKEARLILTDYAPDPEKFCVEEVLEGLKHRSADDLLDYTSLIGLLGYPGNINIQEEHVSPRGYRILDKIPRLPANVIQNLIEQFEILPRILVATIEELDDVEGIGAIRARTIKEGLQRIQEQVLIDRHM